MLKSGRHTPAHLFLDDTPYFITGAIYQRRPLLASSELKAHLVDVLRESFARFGWALHDWVVLDDHYHLLGLSGEGARLTALMRHIHATSARRIHQPTGCELPVWWNYWDFCPRDEVDYRTRQNYLFNNPIKHGYVTDLKDYPYSSFPALLQAQGRETLARQFRDFAGYRALRAVEDDF